MRLWIALQWRPDPALEAPTPEALAWWALRFTPHVAWVDEALLLEVSGTLRLWGGRRALLRRIHEENPLSALASQAQAATSLVALARLRLRVMGQPSGARATELPLHALGAARPHLPLLSQLGCRTWGDAAALPRAGLARRCGPALGQALDVAFGRGPDHYPWATLPERFVQRLELPTRVDDAPALLWAANRLLSGLQPWLQARQLGVLAVELRWRLDARRLNGQALPPTQALVVRTAQPVQRMEHLRRLLAEHLARTALMAPAADLSLRALHTAPWRAESHSLLPDEPRQGEPLHVFVERVSARLGAGRVCRAVPRADHRPECRQVWQPAEDGPPTAPDVLPAPWPDALAPTWLLPEPQPLAVQGGQPRHRGAALRLLTAPRRIEAGWWDKTGAARDYFVAQGAAAELLWVYRERATTQQPGARWFLHGLYG
jgi:protein ImuB